MGALAKRSQTDKAANQPSPVFDNEAIQKVKQRAAELQRRKSAIEVPCLPPKEDDKTY